MMSASTIEEIARDAAQIAEENGVEPLEYIDGDTPEVLQGMPFLGDYVPYGWEMEEEFFVDSSGFGQPGERALTYDQFAEKCKHGYGYGITQAGQFQVYIGEFRRV